MSAMKAVLPLPCHQIIRQSVDNRSHREAGYKPGKDCFIALDSASSDYMRMAIPPSVKADLNQQRNGRFLCKLVDPTLSSALGRYGGRRLGRMAAPDAENRRPRSTGGRRPVRNEYQTIGKGIETASNSILIKLNQIGTLRNHLAIEMAHRAAGRGQPSLR